MNDYLVERRQVESLSERIWLERLFLISILRKRKWLEARESRQDSKIRCMFCLGWNRTQISMAPVALFGVLQDRFSDVANAAAAATPTASVLWASFCVISASQITIWRVSIALCLATKCSFMVERVFHRFSTLLKVAQYRSFGVIQYTKTIVIE